jgi:hypothetical protein
VTDTQIVGQDEDEIRRAGAGRGRRAGEGADEAYDKQAEQESTHGKEG